MKASVILAVLFPSMVLAQQNLPCYANSTSAYQDGLALGCQKNCITSTIKNKTIEMRCDEGFVLLDNVCVRKEELLCPSGSRLVGEACIREITHEPECPIGSELLNGICVRIYDRVCPFSYEMSNGQCVRKVIEPVSCPPGSTKEKNECIRITCPKNYKFENGVCITEENIEETTTCLYTCPEGYIYEDLACRLIETHVDVPPSVTPTVLCPSVQQPGVVYPFTPGPPTLEPQPSCGPGFERRGKECIRLDTYCPKGFVPRGDKCERIACPFPLIWNGQHCVAVYTSSSPGSDFNHTHHINNYNNVTHGTHVNVQNINNVIIYKGGTVVRSSNGTEQTIIAEPTERPEVIGEPKSDCCTVITPRICKNYDSKWRCYNRKYQRCGIFCTRPRIQLRPIQPIYRQQVLVMPPTPPIVPNCGESNCTIGSINCSGCQIGGFCSPSCYQYSCEIINCEFIDHQSFCEEYAGLGCGPQDGPYVE